MMKRLILLTPRPKLIGLLIAFSLIAAACSSSAPAESASNSTAAPEYPSSSTAAPESPSNSAAMPESTSVALPPTGGETVQIADNPQFGRILVTPDGMTLYTNTVDTPEDLRCTNLACTGFWPPYTMDAEPAASAEIQAALGTVTRPDGSKQVTYNQQPLYTFYLDKKAGDTNGNGFTDFGGTWHVVTVGSSPAESSSASNSNDSNSNDSNSGYGGIQY